MPVQNAQSSSTEEVDALLRDGVAAATAGEHERARELLMRVVEQDETCLSAWAQKTYYYSPSGKHLE